MIRRRRFRRGRAWRKLRRQCLEKFDYRCQKCGKAKGAGALEAHHIVPLEHGGLDVLDNLVCWCRDCHISHHAGPLYEKRKAWAADTDQKLREGK